MSKRRKTHECRLEPPPDVQTLLCQNKRECRWTVEDLHAFLSMYFLGVLGIHGGGSAACRAEAFDTRLLRLADHTHGLVYDGISVPLVGMRHENLEFTKLGVGSACQR